MKRDLRYGGTTTDKRERQAIIKSLDKSLTTGNWQAGEEARLLEQEAANYLGLKHGILTVSGSCAGLLALQSLELPKGSEVIISAVTFPTIFNIILQCGLVPVVVDAKVGTYTFDIDEVRAAITPKTRAIIAIHPVGNPVDMPALMKMVKSVEAHVAMDLAKFEGKRFTNKDHKIYVIEDNCDGWGGTINKRSLGSFGDISITSFHAAHIVSMGVGGGVFCNDAATASLVRMYRDWGRLADLGSKEKFGLPKDYPARFIYEKIGYNFQILELQAAMGRVQLKKTEQIKRARKKNFEYLVKHLSKHKQLVMPKVITGADPCWFALPLSVKEGASRGDLVSHLEEKGIETRSMFSGDITRHPAYRGTKYRKNGRLGGADYILRNSFWITVHPRLTQADLDYIVKAFCDHYPK